MLPADDGPKRSAARLLAGHGHAHFALGVDDEVAGKVDGDGERTGPSWSDVFHRPLPYVT